VTDFVALHRICAPGSYAGAYNAGDPVLANVVTDWDLQVGVDVEPTGDYRPPRPADDNTDRNVWEAYVIGKGTDLDAARAASLNDLRGMYEPDPQPEPPAHDLPASAAPEGVDGTGVQNPTPVTADNTPTPDDTATRPAQSARKAEWADYVVAEGGPEQWARADTTTKDDLIAWEPER
jgi:hypothetical protein